MLHHFDFFGVEALQREDDVFAPLRQTNLGAFRYPCLDPKGKTVRPEGAEVQAARLLYDLIKARYRTGTSAEPSEGKGHKFVRGVERMIVPTTKVVPPTTLCRR